MIYNYTPGGQEGAKIDCGTLQYSLQDNVNGMIKIIVLVMPALLMFEWWAVNKILDSTEDLERKTFLVKFTQIMIKGVMLLLFFYQIYWIYLSGIDF